MISLGIQAINANPLKSVKRGIGIRDQVVVIGGVNFVPGEYTYADNNGVIASTSPLSIPERYA
jgi:regulator of ribonuclease activity A